MNQLPSGSRPFPRVRNRLKWSLVSCLFALPVACAHGIENDLTGLGEDGGPPTGQTTGTPAGSGGPGGGGAGPSGSGGRGDATGVGGSSGAGGGFGGATGASGGSTSSGSSSGGTGGSGGSMGGSASGGSGGAADAGMPAGAGGQGGDAGRGGAGGGGRGGSGGAGGAMRDAGPLITVDDSVAGTMNNQFNYVGTWGHCNPCTTPTTPPLYNNTNSWAGGADGRGGLRVRDGH